MQVVILCGGQGTRIRDVADDIPKPMIPIGGRPILWHIMKSYAQFGFKRFILCLGYRSWSIKQYFLDYALANSDVTVELHSHTPATVKEPYRIEDWEVTLAETGLETQTGGRLRRVRKYLEGDHFLLTYGDGVADVNIRALVDYHLRHGKLGTVTAVRAPGRFGELEIEDGTVLQFQEKPLTAQGYINGGFFAFRREFADQLPDRDDLVLERDALTDISERGQLAAFQHDGFWHCMDNSRDYQFLNGLWASGKAPWNTWSAERLRRAA